MMAVEDAREWLAQHPLIAGSFLLLMFAALISFILLVGGIRPGRAREGQTPTAWAIEWSDFGIFLSFLVLWFLLSGSVLLQLHRLLAGADAPIGAGVHLLGGLILQGGMLILFLRMRRHFNHGYDGSLNGQAISWLRACAVGGFYFLATLPVVYGVSAVWNGLLEVLRQKGFQIDLPLQDAVTLIRETDQPLILFGFALLAIIVAPVVEETVFRGGVYRFLKGRMLQPIACFASALLFGMVHGNLHSLPGLIAVGLLLAIVYERTGSLRVAICFHACFNLNSLAWLLLLPQGAL